MANDIGQRNDVIVWHDAGAWFVRAVSPRAMRWVEDNVYDPHWHGSSFIIDHDSIHEVTVAMREDGLVVR